MTFRILMLSALLTLFLNARLAAEIVCQKTLAGLFCTNLNDVRALIVEAARKYGVDPELALKVAEVESGFRQDVVSPKGAVGVMQLMPETARMLGVDPYDLRQNIEGGVAYLKQLLERYNGDVKKALAAYNAGPGAVDKYGGVPPYPETKKYLAKIQLNVKSPYAQERTIASGTSIRKILLPDGTILYTNLPYVLNAK